MVTPFIPNVKTLPPVGEGLIRVFFREKNIYIDVTPRFFDRYLHAGIIVHTNHYGWMCLEDNKILKL